MKMRYNMEATQINKLVQSQRHFFLTGTTIDVNVRIDALKKLYSAIKKHENEIFDALYKDLGKSQFESYMCEVGLTLSEISYMLKHIRKFSREKNVPTPLAQFHSRSFKKPSPRGVVPTTKRRNLAGWQTCQRRTTGRLSQTVFGSVYRCLAV